ncbi:MAG TPA: glucoamylase family protein [Xanthomonadaceae bacterium]|jgi:cellobiose phosphorylase
MTAGREAIVESWLRMRGFLGSMRSPREGAASEPPLRSELFSSDQMERHGRVLARSHKVAAGRSHDLLLARLSANEILLQKACTLLSEAAAAKRRVTPAAEWLLDNFYLIEEQIRIAKRHLPKNYSRELPRLVEGPSAGLPRVYDIALETIAHGDGRVDTTSLSRFIASYQSIAPLALGELWAIPIMLRLALIENLRRVAAHVMVDRIDRNLADYWASRMTDVARSDPRSLVLLIADMARSDPPQSSSFVAELVRRLQGQSSALALPLGWIEQWLGEASRTIEQMVQVENQQQAADQVSISNSIGSLRYLSAMDWREFVETLSVVENALRDDPAGVHARMDFATRDRYRHVVENLARGSTMSEERIAQCAVELAREGRTAQGFESVEAHVGHYLVGDGLKRLEQEIGFRQRLRPAPARRNGRLPLWTFLGPIGLCTPVVAVLLWLQFRSADWHGWPLWLLALPCIVVASDLAVALANWAVTLLVAPRPLPRMDYSEGLPSEARTLVVVPAMLVDIDSVESLVEGLEVRFLANRGPHLHFALLTDFLDAAQPSLASDEPLLDLARRRIAGLNRKYADADGEDRFFLLHRPRLRNERERAWMGRERKRGKLADLNALLRSGTTSAFAAIEGGIDVLAHVRYVVTLDSDTRLPRDAAIAFVATLAHPLNRARWDEQAGRVAAGHGILQPRVGTSLSGAPRSAYARWMASEPGIDPYTRAVSDVYQDLFGEGSFIGKGVYEVESFERALGGRFPDDAILSHDLLEGCYARSGLMSDAQVFEDYPARYATDAARRHRWIRGDWQLLPWLLRRTRREDGSLERNPLSALSRWKIFDNLRRSLVSSALLGLFTAGWLMLDNAAWWTLSLLAVLLFVPLTTLAVDALRTPDELPLRSHLAGLLRSASRQGARIVLQLAFLPHDAQLSLDAIARTLWRMAVSRRHLLQWNPSSEVERSQRQDLGASFLAMWFSPACAIALAGCIARLHPATLAVAAPILCLWLLSPALAWWISRTPARAMLALDEDRKRFVGKLARRNWAFFEDVVGPDDHWLPPDNLQEQPLRTVAHRTSPTNIGLSLLANLAAFDLGYITAAALIERSEATFATLAALDRHRGHFYNWYDTQTLKPLAPRYVSTVDSGNLAGHLLVLAEGLAMLVDAPLLGARIWDGLADTFRLIGEQAVGTALSTDAMAAWGAALASARAQPHDLRSAHAALRELLGATARLRQHPPAVTGEERDWTQALFAQCQAIASDLVSCAPWLDSGEPPPDGLAPMPSLRELAHCGSGLTATRATDRIDRLAQIERRARELAGMEYGFLYDRTRHLLAIGYNVDERRRDEGYYDLLASEARLCSFVAIAQGRLPQEGWFALGRQLTSAGGEPVLLSWSGSMFEYLMPQLVMPSYEDSLLDATMRASVARQIEYGRRRGVPWGISESGYNTVDAQLNYQYRAFGVPGLGLKRGLAQDLVVAPYATALALAVAPEAACANLQRMEEAGYLGVYGMYEAIDFTPSRLPRGHSAAVIRSFMAHHQGMSLLAFAQVLADQPMQRRFRANREFQSALLLLQERPPKTAVVRPHIAESPEQAVAMDPAETRLRIFRQPDTPMPAVQMLSNGRYSVMVTHVGGGYSALRDIAVTRWREDATTDARGSFCYVRDLDGGAFWSVAHQPTRVPVERYEAIFSDARAEFRGRRIGIETHAEIVVSPEDDIELRRVTLTNRSRARRTIELTSYAEVVLAPTATDASHPAFGNLFVQSELVRAKQAILCHRRPQAEHDPERWLFHMIAVHGADIQAISYETDRSKFVGRGRDLARPLAMEIAALSDSEGSVLDPVVAIRARMTLEPDQVAVIDFVSGVADHRDACLPLIEKYRDRRLADRVFDLAWTHSQVVRRQINASQSDAQLYERLAGSILHANPALRADPVVLARNRRGQSGLWGYSISGDLPIVLLQIADPENIELVRQLVQAHAYWRLKGLAVDLVIWNEDHAGYRQELNDRIMGLIAAGHEANAIDKSGGIYVRASQQMSAEDRILMLSVARIVLSDARGTLAEQVVARRHVEPLPARHVPAQTAKSAPSPAIVLDPVPVRNDNGLGGFSGDGREYIVTLAADQATPAPWCNVLANPDFGCVVSESGPGYTWAENAHEFRLTPWHNDPVSDPCGEAYYLRDEESGRVWSPTPLPCRGEGAYRIRHGFGYSVYEHVEDGIASELWLFVAIDAPIKYAMLKLRNLSGRTRRISAIGYVEWVLGELRTKGLMHVTTERDAASGALLARNAYSSEFGERVAFFDVDERERSVTGDRTEFIGRNGSLRNPAALQRVKLSGRVGAGLDPCGAIGVTIALIDELEHTTVFRLGAARDEAQARTLASQQRDVAAAQRALEAVRTRWSGILGCVQVRTPDPALDLLANGWLLYQVIACRFWGRSGYYQSSGAYGFRDQLQDSMAMLHAEPALVREHLLRCAAHQFPEGDAQHWWHPPQGRGVRTRCSDDYLWLPFATIRYVEATGDAAVLDAPAFFVEGRALNPEEESWYDLPARSQESQTLYDHCVRAIEHVLTLRGANGLPLMGSGDWNDGMNRVGIGGKGESVWLAFFLHDVLARFAALASTYGDAAFARHCRDEAGTLRKAIEAHAWDGAWYRRAWFDDGTPLGTAGSAECAIDSIAQSWSVLSGAGEESRTRTAMRSLDQHLVKREAKIVQLLDPPFDRNAARAEDRDPGYIAAYVPGVRENGGQYTHAAAWAAMAFAELGQRDKAWELLGMINPIHHGGSAETIARYKVEPYVMAADVYAQAPHTGRGGWTWYTGSAGWTYRLIVETLLGLRRDGKRLRIVPRIPADWPAYAIDYRHGSSLWRIEITRVGHDHACGMKIDGTAPADDAIELVDDGREHRVEIAFRDTGDTVSTTGSRGSEP